MLGDKTKEAGGSVLRLFIIFLMICIYINIYGDRFILTKKMPKGAVGNPRYNGPIIFDMDRDNRMEIWTSRYWHDTEGDTTVFEITVYEHNTVNDSFYIDKEIHRYGRTFDGIGDPDGDGLWELMVGNFDSNKVFLLEQPDSFSYPDTITWASDTSLAGARWMGFSKFMKDSVDIIYGNGCPGVSNSVGGYGWFYMKCTGDNSYEIYKEFEKDSSVAWMMDVGDVDGDSLCDVVCPMHAYIKIFEKVPEDPDSYAIVMNDHKLDNGVDFTLILPDMDKDGHNEIITGMDNGGTPCHYWFFIIEDEDGDAVYDTTYRWDMYVDTDVFYIVGSDCDWGDVDGDGENELVLCGGRHLEVWKSNGNNSYYKIYEWTNPGYSSLQSHVRCYDFNGNGYDEIIYTGVSYNTGSDSLFIFEDSSVVLYMDSAIAYDGDVEVGGIDGDDYVEIYFSNRSNGADMGDAIDSILVLSGGHSWLDGSGGIKRYEWIGDSSILRIYLDTVGGLPSVAVGDTIYPNRGVIKIYDNSTPVKGISVIGGSFGVNGMEMDSIERGGVIVGDIEVREVKGGVQITNYTGEVIIYDITGRTVKTAYITTPDKTIQLNTGIYFIKIGNKIRKVNVVR